MRMLLQENVASIYFKYHVKPSPAVHKFYIFIYKSVYSLNLAVPLMTTAFTIAMQACLSAFSW